MLFGSGVNFKKEKKKIENWKLENFRSGKET